MNFFRGKTETLILASALVACGTNPGEDMADSGMDSEELLDTNGENMADSGMDSGELLDTNGEDVVDTNIEVRDALSDVFVEPCVIFGNYDESGSSVDLANGVFGAPAMNFSVTNNCEASITMTGLTVEASLNEEHDDPEYVRETFSDLINSVCFKNFDSAVSLDDCSSDWRTVNCELRECEASLISIGSGSDVIRSGETERYSVVLFWSPLEDDVTFRLSLDTSTITFSEDISEDISVGDIYTSAELTARAE